MLNLRWSWHADTRELFAALDPAGREVAGRDPITLLGEGPPEHLARMADDRDFLRRLAAGAKDLQDYLAGPRWYQLSADETAGPAGRRPGCCWGCGG